MAVRGFLGAVGLLLGLAAGTDRIAVVLAEEGVSGAIAEQAQLASQPEVDIAGFPFLTQAVGGRYEEVRISLTAADLGQPEGTRAEVLLQGVQVPLSGVLSRSVREVPVERIEGTILLSYQLMSQQLGPTTALTPEGDRLRITRTVELMGRRLPLTAAGRVLLDGNDLVVDVEHAAGAGVPIPASLVARASDLLDLRYRLQLPFGLRVTDVAPDQDGIAVAVAATDAVLQG